MGDTEMPPVPFAEEIANNPWGYSMFWWVRFIIFSAVALFFLIFGIEEMTRAYQGKNPHEFLASFFSASFIILISGTLLVGFLWRMILRVKEKRSPESGENSKRNRLSG